MCQRGPVRFHTLPPIDTARAIEALCFVSSDSRERCTLWADGFGAEAVRDGGGPSYANLVSSAETSRTIEKDVPRTLPDHDLFRDLNGTGCTRLRRMLCALRAHPRGGYCQGLNFVAALVLLAHAEAGDAEAEQAVWTLIAIRSRFGGLWEEGLPLVGAASGAIDSLLRASSPDLHAHLEQHALQSAGELARAWLLCLFAHPSMPLPCRFWLWDVMAASATRTHAAQEAAALGIGCAVCATVAVIRAKEAALRATTDPGELQRLLGDAWSDAAADLRRTGMAACELVEALNRLNGGASREE